MSSRTRYLQLSDTTMMEYVVNDSLNVSPDSYIYTKLLDGHYCVFSPLSHEVELVDDHYDKMKQNDIVSLNTISHLAIPTDKKDSNWYAFLDNDYNYVDSSVYDTLDEDNIIAKQYAQYCTSPDDSSTFIYLSTGDQESAGYDTIKLYFVSGYDFSDIYAAVIRISVNRRNGEILDLCNFIYNRGNVYKYIKYITTPIIFGNFVYDKYIEIKVPSLRTLDDVTLEDGSSLGELLLGGSKGISYEPNIKMLFSYIDNDDKTISHTVIKESAFDIAEEYKNTELKFVRTNSIKASIPTQTLTSDNLGVYIAPNADYPYLEFYGTWKGEALTSYIINNFNTTVQLYDRAYVRRESTYEVPADYQAGYNLNNWIAVHEITCELLNTDFDIVKSEKYSMTQVFTGEDNETTKFYYRPTYLDELADTADLTMHIKYVMRFINISDSVQFLKQGSLSITDLNRYSVKASKLNVNTSPYKIYNKIIEKKQTVTASVSPSTLKSKFVKVFYDSSTITLDENGVPFSNNTYVLQLSKTPKTYKFVFKQKDFNGNLKYFDLSDSSYKLYSKDAAGNEIILEPTYTNNMNLNLGEVEFNINSSVLTRLANVPANRRFISIVAYNSDNSVSSMYDMTYTI